MFTRMSLGADRISKFGRGLFFVVLAILLGATCFAFGAMFGNSASLAECAKEKKAVEAKWLKATAPIFDDLASTRNIEVPEDERTPTKLTLLWGGNSRMDWRGPTDRVGPPAKIALNGK